MGALGWLIVVLVVAALIVCYAEYKKTMRDYWNPPPPNPKYKYNHKRVD